MDLLIEGLAKYTDEQYPIQLIAHLEPDGDYAKAAVEVDVVDEALALVGVNGWTRDTWTGERGLRVGLSTMPDVYEDDLPSVVPMNRDYDEGRFDGEYNPLPDCTPGVTTLPNANDDDELVSGWVSLPWSSNAKWTMIIPPELRVWRWDQPLQTWWLVENGESYSASVTSPASFAALLENVTFEPGSTLAVNVGDGLSFTYSGDISGNFTLKKTGPGTLVLSGDNTYTSGTIIDEGVLKITAVQALSDFDVFEKITVHTDGTLTILAGDSTGLWNAEDLYSLVANAVFHSGSTLGIDTSEATGSFTCGYSITGELALVKLGVGTLVLAAENDYVGDTTIYAGTLQIGGENALPGGENKGNLVFADPSAVLDLAGYDISINSLIGSGTIRSTNTINTSVLTFGDNDQSATFSGAIEGGVCLGDIALHKIGEGTLVLEGTNTYTGDTTISGGTLTINNCAIGDTSTVIFDGGALQWNYDAVMSSAIQFNINADKRAIIDTNGYDVTIAGQIIGSTATLESPGDGGMHKIGSGTLTLTGDNSYFGGTTISDGIIEFSDSGLADSGDIIFDGGTLKWATGNTEDITLSRFVSINEGKVAVLDIGGPVHLSGNISGSGGLTKIGDGTLFLDGPCSYAGDTILSAGSIELGCDNAIPSGADMGDLQIDGTLDLAGYDLIVNGLTGSGVINTSKEISDPDDPDIAYLLVGDNDQDGHFTGQIMDGAGLLSLIKIGEGEFTLDGTGNSYSGGTMVYSGTLRATNVQMLPGYDVSGSIIVWNEGTLAVVAHTSKWSESAIDTLLSNAIFDPGSTLGFDTTVGDFTYGTGEYTIDGDLGLKKLGDNTLTLSSENSYKGDTTISAGTLSFAYGALGEDGDIIFDGGVMRWNYNESESTPTDISDRFAPIADGVIAALDTGSFNVTLAGNITGEGGIQKLGGGTLTIEGVNTYDGGTTISGGVLTFTDGALGSGGVLTFDGGILKPVYDDIAPQYITIWNPVVINSGKTADVDTNGNDLDISYGISGDGGLRKLGAGTLTVDGVNDFAGGTQINAGTLEFGMGSLGEIGAITFSGGTLRWLEGNTEDVSSRFGSFGVLSLDTNGQNVMLISNVAGTGLNKLGEGTLTLAGGNSYSGCTTISDGTLAFDGISLGSSTIFFDGGALQWMGNGSHTNAIQINADKAAVFDTNGYDVTLSGYISGSNDEGIQKLGAGTLALSGGANFTGDTMISDGTLEMGIAGAIPVCNMIIESDGVLELAGHNRSLNALSGSGDITSTESGTITLSIGGGSQSSEFSGNISDSGAAVINLVKNGTGKLILSGNNNYSGTTTVSNGTLHASSAGALPGYSTENKVVVDSNCMLSVNAGEVSEWDADQIEDLLAETTFYSNTTFGIDTTNAGANIFTYGNTITGVMRLQKLGEGTLYLSATDNSYSGGTTISEGVLSFNDGSLGTSGDIIFDGGTLQWAAGNQEDLSASSRIAQIATDKTAFIDIVNNNTVSFSSSISLEGSLCKNGGGTLILNAANNDINSFIVEAGTLQVGATSAMGSCKDVTVNEYGTLDIGGYGIEVMTLSGAGTITSNPITGTSIGILNVYGGGIFTGVITDGEETALKLVVACDSLTFNGTGDSTYSGGTTVSGGSLVVSDPGKLPGYNQAGKVIVGNYGSLVVCADGTNGWGTSNINDLLTYATFNSNASSYATLGINTSGGAFSYGGIASGKTVTLQKCGSGTLTLTGSNGYVGGTIISGGTLSFSSGAFPTSGSITFDGGTIQWGSGIIVDLSGRFAPIPLGKEAIVDIVSGNDVTFAEAISGGGGFRKIGEGRLALTGTSTLSGSDLTICDGTLAFGSDALSSVASIVFDGGTLESAYDASGVQTIEIDGNIVVAEGETACVNTDRNEITFSGTVSGDGGIEKLGPGTLIFNAAWANSYTGDTTVSAGTLIIDNAEAIPHGDSAGNLIIADGASFDMAGNSITVNGLSGLGTITSSVNEAVILTVGDNDQTTIFSGTIHNGSGTLALRKIGTGTLTLGDENTYSGDTTISAGTLKIGDPDSIPNGTDLGNVIIETDALLDLAGLDITINGLSGSGTVTSSETGAATLAVGDNNQTCEFAGVIEDDSGTVALTKIGSGSLTLSGNNTYSGDTSIDAGSLVIGETNALPSGTDKGNLSIATGAVLDLAGFSATINGLSGLGTVTSSGVDIVSTLTVGDNNQNSEFSGDIEDGDGTVALVKIGSGTLTLSGTNVYSGDTSVRNTIEETTDAEGVIHSNIIGGMLKLGSDYALPSVAGIGRMTIDSACSLDVAGHDVTLYDLNGSGKITSSVTETTVVTLTVGEDDSSAFSGVIENGDGTVALVKVGGGTLTLSGTNTYGGGTTITAGTLQVGDGITTGTLGSGAIIDNGSLVFHCNSIVELETSISGTGSLSVQGCGVLLLSAAATYVGDTVIEDSATLQIGENGDLPPNATVTVSGKLDLNGYDITLNELAGSGTVTSSSTGTATITIGDDDETFEFTGVIEDGSGKVGVHKIGTGTVTLSGDNTFTGPMTVGAGVLELTALSSLPSVENGYEIAGIDLDIAPQGVGLVLTGTVSSQSIFAPLIHLLSPSGERNSVVQASSGQEIGIHLPIPAGDCGNWHLVVDDPYSTADNGFHPFGFRRRVHRHNSRQRHAAFV